MCGGGCVWRSICGVEEVCVEGVCRGGCVEEMCIPIGRTLFKVIRRQTKGGLDLVVDQQMKCTGVSCHKKQMIKNKDMLQKSKAISCFLNQFLMGPAAGKCQEHWVTPCHICMH